MGVDFVLIPSANPVNKPYINSDLLIRRYFNNLEGRSCIQTRHFNALKDVLFGINKNRILFGNLKYISIDMPVNQFVRNVLNLVLRVEIECLTYQI